MRWKIKLVCKSGLVPILKMKKGVQSQVLESSPANANLSFAFLARQMCLGVI